MAIRKDRELTRSPYNPLDKRNIGESIVRELLAREKVALAPAKFDGAGVYAIYYRGRHPAYEPISDSETPIYVGKAEPSGGRRGGLGLRPQQTETLSRRLKEHADSVKEVPAEGGLSLDEFTCRYLVVDDVWIPLGETLLIQQFLPVWNRVVDGFGNHDPGGGRRLQKRSPWDELHPGRAWAKLAAEAKEPKAEILSRIAEHFQRHVPDRASLDK